MLKRFKKINCVAGLVLALCCNYYSYAQVSVTANIAAPVLAAKLAGAGITVSNAVLHCPSQANGLFSVLQSNLGLDSGIVLTTGRAATQGNSYGINGPQSFFASTQYGLPGDATLSALAGVATYDACALEFDVVPLGDTVKFDYVFSSEEYKSAVCGQYNDAFAFFISGPGISGAENMALVPGTNIPVTINSINNGIPGGNNDLSNCTIMGAGAPFTGYYVDNTQGQTLTHWGLTTVLTALHAVTPCNTYHFKLVIADGGNDSYDSGVFLKAGSLQATDITVKAIGPADPVSSVPYVVKGCTQGQFVVKRSKALSVPQTIRYTTGGTAIAGTDYTQLTDSVVIPAGDTIATVTVQPLVTPLNGTKSLVLYADAPFTCNGQAQVIDSAAILIYDAPYVTIATTDTTQCSGDSILLQAVGQPIYSYTWSPAVGLSNPLLPATLAFPAITTTYTVSAAVSGGNCAPATASITITVRASPQIVLSADTVVCFNSTISVQSSATPAGHAYNYSWVGPAGYTSSQQDIVIPNAGHANAGYYNILVTDAATGCSSADSILLGVNVPDTPGVSSPFIACFGSAPVSLTAAGENLKWYSVPGDSGVAIPPVISTADTATSYYYVSQTLNGCESPKAQIETEVKRCCDGIYFIPNAFTPNGDTRNDKFELVMDYGYSIKKMFVYNRWGQVVYQADSKNAWDGTFNGQPAEVGNYFYYIVIGCINGPSFELKGDVILIR